MTLEEAQKQVDHWIKTYGVRYFSELTNMAVLTEEVGELARIMARTYGDQSFKEGEKHDLSDEMADDATNRDATRLMMLNTGLGRAFIALLCARPFHWLPTKNSMFVFTRSYWLGTSWLLYCLPSS